MTIRVAYLVNPHLGGTYTIFTRLRGALVSQGVDFRGVAAVGTTTANGPDGSSPDGIDRVCVPPTPREATARILEHLQREGYGLVLATPGAGELTSNLPRYLPRSIRCMARVCTMTHGVYRPTRAIAPHVDAIVAVSERIRNDLVGRFRLDARHVRTISNGVPVAGAAKPRRVVDGALRLLYLGRLEDIDKGVCQLPLILRHTLRAVPGARLTIVGTGPDETELRIRLEQAGVARHVRLPGALPPDAVPVCLAAHDALVLPSRFEGCPSALLEAMACGCVPIASAIHGATTTMIEAGVSGFLCPVGDVRGFARAAARLAHESGLRERMGQAAQQRIRDGFSLDRMAARYAELFREVLSCPERRAAPQPLAAYEVPRGLAPTWRTRIPRPVKNLARKWAERLGVSV